MGSSTVHQQQEPKCYKTKVIPVPKHHTTYVYRECECKESHILDF